MENRYQQKAIELLVRLISTPSISRQEEAVALIIEEALRHEGHAPLRIGNNVWAKSPHWDDALPTLLLNSHMDTVRPVQGWDSDPYTPIVDEDRIVGLGSNDAGAPLVTLLYTFVRLSKEPQPYNLVFLASAEEEISGKGGVEMALRELPPITVAIVGEPTEMQPAIAEKGLMVLDCITRGVSGHAARNDGENAIYKAMADIKWFKKYQFARVSPLLGEVRMQVTMIESGTQHNVIPDACSFVVDVRSTECYTNEELYERIARNVRCEVRARSFRLNSSGIDRNHPIIRRCVRRGRQPFGSPTLSDQALMSFPSVKMGPGVSQRSHTANEYILIREIAEALELYHDLLDQKPIVEQPKTVG